MQISIIINREAFRLLAMIYVKANFNNNLRLSDFYKLASKIGLTRNKPMDRIYLHFDAQRYYNLSEKNWIIS